MGMTQVVKTHEIGFMAVISVEPIYECLAAHKLLPECQKVRWGDFWNTDNWDYVIERGPGMSEAMANVSLHDDGKSVYVGLYCREPNAMNLGLNAVAQVAQGKQMEVTRTSDMHARITFEGAYDEALAWRLMVTNPARSIHYRNKRQVPRGVKRTHGDVSAPAALQKGSSLVANGAFFL
jgi:hypothetical protein